MILLLFTNSCSLSRVSFTCHELFCLVIYFRTNLIVLFLSESVCILYCIYFVLIYLISVLLYMVFKSIQFITILYSNVECTCYLHCKCILQKLFPKGINVYVIVVDCAQYNVIDIKLIPNRLVADFGL